MVYTPLLFVWVINSSRRIQTSMIYVLRYLNQDIVGREDLSDQLMEHMDSMSEAIKDFGASLTGQIVIRSLIVYFQAPLRMCITRNANHG